MRVLAPFGRRPVPVVESRPSGSYRVFTVEDREGPAPRPGQFYMLAAVERWDADGERPYLPRAFSVALAADGRLSFLVEAVGPGSARLAALTEGEQLWIAGPLGRPFTVPAGGAALAGGGIGVAPLALLQRGLAEAGVAAPALLGFRDREHAGGWDLFEGEVRLASEDGHLGERGRVTDLLAPLLEGEPPPAVYACGPPAMLEAVRALSAGRGAACELAMESGMACGYGACMGCVVPTRNGYVRLCIDGPVIDAAQIETAL